MQKRALNKVLHSYNAVRYVDFLKSVTGLSQVLIEQKYIIKFNSTATIAEVWKRIKNIASSHGRVQRVPNLTDPT